MKNKLTLKVANVVFLFLTLLVNFLANYLPINGLTSGEVSDFYKNPFTLAGFTFSIWGVIYVLLIVFVVYQFVGKGKILEKFSTGYYFIVACLANMGWLYLWHNRHIGLAMILILFLLLVLFQIFKRLHQYDNYSIMEYIALKLPFSIYTAWVSIASIANLMALLVYFNASWSSNFLTTVSVMGVVAGLFIVFKVLNVYQNIPFALVVVWAYIGIIGAQLGSQLTNIFVLISAGVSIVMILFKTITTYQEK